MGTLRTMFPFDLQIRLIAGLTRSADLTPLFIYDDAQETWKVS